MINLSRHAYPWGVVGAAARVGVSKHLDPLLGRVDAVVNAKAKPTYYLPRNLAVEFWDGL